MTQLVVALSELPGDASHRFAEFGRDLRAGFLLDKEALEHLALIGCQGVERPFYFTFRLRALELVFRLLAIDGVSEPLFVVRVAVARPNGPFADDIGGHL